MCDLHDLCYTSKGDDSTLKCDMSLEENFFGTATVGERGQVVIPSEARKKFGIQPGDKVLVLGHPAGSGLVFCKIDAMRELFSSFLEELQKIESQVTESSEENGEAKVV